MSPSPSDDALDFLDSLVIFDRICPFAVEHLPAMSRRVFDVGLDMGRIRNGLKSNKESKRSKSYRSTATQDQKSDDHTDDTPNPNQLAMVPQMKHKNSSPTINGQQNQNPSLPDAGHKHQRTQDFDFPMPPKHSSSSPEYVNGERSLHSSQFNPPDDSPTTAQRPDHIRRPSDTNQNFDLKPPPPNTRAKHVDTLSEKLLSGDHLKVILKDPSFFLRFTAFLNRYRPNLAPVLMRYLEAQKAIKAVEYANALAETIKPAPGEHNSPCAAASVDPRFEARSKRAFDTLIVEALPAYITNSLTKVVTESMVREITGTGMPVMRELVGGLAEVFCLADPSVKDCPIVYASEEFYRTTRYSRDDVLGRNCRFLQGPKTDQATISRLSSMIKAGQESCETILNYRRDGSPFMNLLLTAPLYDNRGAVRYFIGAQIDVSGLIEDGRGLESFERLLHESRPNRERDSGFSEDGINQRHLKALNELSQMLSVDESSLLQGSHSRTSSMADNTSSVNYSYRHNASKRDPSVRYPRRVLGNEDDTEGKERSDWALSSSISSGRLPGVYQNYLLVRPFPSLRIIFVSPALRIPGLLQSPFLSRIGGPVHVRDGLSEAFEQGAAVTAKVTWLPQGKPAEDGDHNLSESRPVSRKGPQAPEGISGAGVGKTRYISCTPLLGSDDQVGVWMIVMVENELVTGSLASRDRAMARYMRDVPVPATPSEYQREDLPSMESTPSAAVERNNSANIRDYRKGKVGSEGGRLYAEFMRASNASGNGGPGSTNEDSVNGVSGEGRVEELISPTEEKPRVF